MENRDVLLERFLYSFNKLPRWKQWVICYKMEFLAFMNDLKNTRLRYFFDRIGFDNYYKR